MKTLIKLVFIMISLIIQTNGNAQILKKLKNKIDNTIDKTVDKKIDNTVDNEVSNGNNKDYCEDEEALKNYKMVYKGTGNTKILYQESSISMKSNGDDYKVIFKEGSGKEAIYTVIENDKTLYNGNKLTNDLVKKPSWSIDSKDRMKKYLIIDSTKTTLGGNPAMSGKYADKIDEEMLMTGIELSKQTAEYQAMSAEEKAEFDQFAKEEVPKAAQMYNNSGLAGTNYNFPGNEGITVHSNNSSLIVNGKNYLSKNDMLMDYFVSNDEKSVFIYGTDANGKQFFQTNDKRNFISNDIQKSSFSSQLLISKDGKKAKMEFINQIEESKINAVYGNSEPTKVTFVDSDGTNKSINVNLNNYVLSNDGKIISANSNNGQIAVDGKNIGKLNTNEPLNINSLLIAGTTPDKIYKYNANGSIESMDGKIKNLGALFPVVKIKNEKSYLYWFMECGSTIYLANTEL
jgi:hypothetical protein